MVMARRPSTMDKWTQTVSDVAAVTRTHPVSLKTDSRYSYTIMLDQLCSRCHDDAFPQLGVVNVTAIQQCVRVITPYHPILALRMRSS
jgi:hypothetical protein